VKLQKFLALSSLIALSVNIGLVPQCVLTAEAMAMAGPSNADTEALMPTAASFKEAPKEPSKDLAKEQPKEAAKETPKIEKAEVEEDTGNAAPGDLTVDEVKVEGNRLVPSDEIMNVVKTRPGDKFDRDQVAADLKAINGLGYFDDRTLKAVPERTTNGVLLKITVTENQPVSQFSFEGNKVLSSEVIHKMFADQLERPQNLNRLSTAIDTVEKAYHEKGFVLARVTDVKDDPDGSISLNINEGVIDDIKISGNHKTKDFIIKKYIKVKSGGVYNEKQLTGDLRQLFANGYFQDIRRSLAPSATNPDKYTLKVEVDEKRTGSVNVGGGVDTIAGPFGSLGFGDNNFRGRGEGLSFNAQVGTGMFGTITNTLNNAGQQFMSTAKTYQIEANYTKQVLDGTTMTMSAFGRNFNSQLIDYSQQRTIGASVNFQKKLKGHFRANLGLTGENTHMTDLSQYYTDVSLIDQMATRAIQLGQQSTIPGALQEAQTARSNILKGGTFLSVSPNLTYDTRDRVMDPTHGMYAKISATPSLGLNGAGFAKAGASVTKAISVTKETTWITNLQAGTSMGSLPGFSQYRLGGFNGIPGYRQFSDLGSGNSLLMGTTEFRHRLPIPKTDNKIVDGVVQNVKVATFLSGGVIGGNNIYNSLLSRNSMGASVGIGLRLNLQMLGMVRIDYGYPLISTVLGGHTPRVTFGFGERF
jgi:outer membrane protein insertion porin family